MHRVSSIRGAAVVGDGSLAAPVPIKARQSATADDVRVMYRLRMMSPLCSLLGLSDLLDYKTVRGGV